MRSLLTILLLVILSLPAHAGHPFGQPFDLHVGAALELGDDTLNVGFVGILEDSRCPEGVTCFWEGDASVHLWLQVAGQARQEFVLHSAGSLGQQSIEMGDYTVSLVLVAPYPVIDVPIDPDSYVITLVVHEGAVNEEVRSWGAIQALYR